MTGREIRNLVLLFLIVAGIVVSVTLDPSPGYPATCRVAEVTPENTQLYSPQFWQAAGYAANYSKGDPPTLLVQPFTASQAVIQEDEHLTAEEAIDGLGGCYGPEQNIVQMTPGLPPGRRIYILIHELVHARLHLAGIPIERHHCWMAEHNVSGRIVGWMAKNLGANPQIYSQARIGEIVACNTSFRLEFPPEEKADQLAESQ